MILVGNYSGKKLLADATLDKAVRMPGAIAEVKFEADYQPDDILKMGDDDFLRSVEGKLDEHFQYNILRDMRNGIFFQSAIELTASNYRGAFQDTPNRLAMAAMRSR